MQKVNQRSFWINKKDKEEHWVTSVSNDEVITWGIGEHKNTWRSSIKDFLENFDFKCEGEPLPEELLDK